MQFLYLPDRIDFKLIPDKLALVNWSTYPSEDGAGTNCVCVLPSLTCGFAVSLITFQIQC